MALSKDKYIVYHGIKLSDNSCIANCEIETFANDPVVVRPGRIWFNSSEKVFKYSGLTETNQVVIKSFSDYAGLTQFIDNLMSNAPGHGANMIGYEGISTPTINIPSSSIKETLDTLVNELSTLKSNMNNLVIIDEYVCNQEFNYIIDLTKRAYSKSKLLVLINGLEQHQESYNLYQDANRSIVEIPYIFLDDKVKIINFELV